MQDFRLALRTIRSTPVVTSAAILSLALGIGASTAIFGLVNSLVLRSLPVAEPQRLVMLSTGPAATQSVFTYAAFDQIRQQRLTASASIPAPKPAATASSDAPDPPAVTTLSETRLALFYPWRLL